jgi:hypothetical protein
MEEQTDIPCVEYRWLSLVWDDETAGRRSEGEDGHMIEARTDMKVPNLK